MRTLWAIFLCVVIDTLQRPGSALQVASPGDIQYVPPTSLTEFERYWPSWASWKRRTKGSDTSPDASTGKSRYIDVKLKQDRRALDSLDIDEALSNTKLGNSLSHPRHKKVAFLFMLMDDLDWPQVWNHFFADAKPHQYSIYVHRANATFPMEDLKLVSRWGAIDVPRVPNSWCALMGVEVALILAALKDPFNAQFVFVSHDTVPLKGFSYIHSELAVESPDTSKFCLVDQPTHKKFVQEEVMNEITRHCLYRDFYTKVNPRTPKHHQWAVLSRSHAVTVARRAKDGLDYWEPTWRSAASDLQNMGEGCSDEAVPLATLLLDLEQSNESTGDTFEDLEKLGVEQQCLTLVHWHNCFGRTELELPKPELMTSYKELLFFFKHLDEILRFLEPGDYDWLQSPFKLLTNEFPHSFTNTTLMYLNKVAKHHGFMFARKFPPGLQLLDEKDKQVRLSDVLPKLWRQVNETEAKQRVWSRNSLAGHPEYKAMLSKRRSRPYFRKVFDKSDIRP